MAVNQQYIDQATSQLKPTHNSQVDSIKNQLAQNQLALDQQKTSVNKNYDLNVQNANLNNRLNKNSVSNAMLGRGLANSSIAVSGLAEQDAKNARVQSDIERARLSDLNNIDANKALLEQNANNTIGQMDRDLNDKILALAMQLEDRQWEKDFKDKGFQLQQQQFEYDKSYKDKLFEQSQQAQMFDQQYKNQMLAMQQEAQKYEQQYKDAMLKMEQEKMKFDMGYQNRYLEMQKEAQQAEIAYKNSMLALQQQQAQADEDYRWAQLQWEQEKYEDEVKAQKDAKYEASYDNYRNLLMNVIADNSKSEDEKIKATQTLVNTMESDTKQYGYNYDNLINQYADWRKNIYNPTTTSWSGNTSKTPTTSTTNKQIDYDKYTWK